MKIFGVDLRKYSFILLRMAMGIKLSIDNIPESKGCVIVSNHASYTDILILGGIFNASFVGKSELRKWPVIGWIAKCFGVIFIDRKKAGAQGDLKRMIGDVARGKNVIFFPEGTTSDGCRVLPFKSLFFEIPEGTVIRPVSIEYSYINGFPARRFDRKLFSWIGDLSLLDHLREVLKVSEVRATVSFYPKIISNGDRKRSCGMAFDVIKRGLSYA